MHEVALLTVFVADIFGSTHCLGMCGGIATALGTARSAVAWQPLVYQAGRISSYAIGGGIVGAADVAAGMTFETSLWSAVLRLATAMVVVSIGIGMALGSDHRRGRRLRASAGEAGCAGVGARTVVGLVALWVGVFGTFRRGHIGLRRAGWVDHDGVRTWHAPCDARLELRGLEIPGIKRFVCLSARRHHRRLRALDCYGADRRTDGQTWAFGAWPYKYCS